MSQEQKPRIYCGSGKKVEGYDLVNYAFDVEVLLQNAYTYNGKRLVNVTCASKREVDQYGKSHTAFIREVNNNNQNNQNNTTNNNNAPEPVQAGTGLPF